MARRAKKRIRISGLVSLMNHAREGLAAGIPRAQVPAFRRMVTQAVGFVEQSCRESGASSQDLPAPSRRAYEYLRGIDLENLPILEEQEQSAPKRIRISNVISSSRNFQEEFAAWARRSARAPGERGALEGELPDLHARISGLASLVEELAVRLEAAPSDLPDPTLRAYQWLKYLSDGEAFQQHLDTLRRAYKMEKGAHFELYNIAGLFRSRVHKGVRQITASEAFIGAPQPVIEALMRLSGGKKDGRSMLRIRQYAQGEEFSDARLDLELIGVRQEEDARGAHYDLGEVFSRVDERYFRGRMGRPILTWNRTITHAKFGHYVPATDTVMISIALDSPQVPSYAIEHVMHHELLHRKLGVRFANGRRIAHTPQFKAAEQSFEGYEQASDFLRVMSRDLR